MQFCKALECGVLDVRRLKVTQQNCKFSRSDRLVPCTLRVIYAEELLLYLLLHLIQIQKGLFLPAVFIGILAVLFLWAVVLLLFFLVRKIRKKERWKWWEFLFLPLQSIYSIWLGYEFLIGILFF